jgi:CRISPR-associated helicase Cas3
VTTIGALTLPTYTIPEIGIPLLGHQVVVQQRWDSLEALLITAGTGTGKTLAVFLPALLRAESVIAVYPTNALLLDQAESIVRLAKTIGKEARVLQAGDSSTKPGHADVEIIPINGPILDRTRQAMKLRRNGEALDALLTISSRPKIIVTNPDVLYLMAAMCYRDSQSALTRLSSYSTLVLDEFHMYAGLELARFLYLTYLLRFFAGQVSQGLRRVALLSATPSGETLSLLREVLPTLQEITPEVTVSAAQIGLHTSVYPLSFSTDLTTAQVSHHNEDDAGLIRKIVRFLNARGDFLRSERLYTGERTVPALVFLNSVVEAKRLERALLASGWSESELGSVRGLMSQEERRWEGKTVVVATAAAEVGIDFDCRLLIFETSDRGSFAQRLGRGGRHAPAEAYSIGRSGAPGIFGLRTELERRPTELSRQGFLDLAASVFRASDAQIDFVTSKEGIFAAASLTSYILQRVASDYGADSIVRERVRQTLVSMERTYFLQWQSRRNESVSDVAKNHLLVRRDMDRAVQGRSAAAGWMKIYLDNFPSFRSQSLQVSVFDQEEESRGREAIYRADLRTLARWAQLGVNHRFVAGVGYVVDIVKYVDAPHRYFVVLHRPPSWPINDPWPPEELFWVGREEDVQTKVLKATLISDGTGGRFPGPFPPEDDLLLALVMTREQLALLDFDWRLQSWPLRGQAGTASDVQPRIILLGDACLLANSRLRRVPVGIA